MKHIVSLTPVVLGGALIIPQGLLSRLRNDNSDSDPGFAADAAARSHIERIAMDTVRKAEEQNRCTVMDVSDQKCGWDLSSYPPPVDGKQNQVRHIEVKGRIKGATTVTITRNEILYAFNQSDKFILAIVLVGEDDSVEGPFYIREPFTEEPGWGVASINYDLGELLSKAEEVHHRGTEVTERMNK
jgi:hypothetical protein